jgi:uncharacterized protein (DUF58 family)
MIERRGNALASGGRMPAGAVAAAGAVPAGIRPPLAKLAKLTREGRYWLLLSAILLALGLYKGINLLCLLAYVMLACLAVNLLLAGRRLNYLSGNRRIEELAFAGEPFAVELRAVNSGWTVQFGVGVEDEAPQRGGFAFSSRLASGQTLLHRREVVLPKRGRYAWGPLTAVSGYPFGLAQRRCVLTAGEDVLILPRLGRLHRGRLRRYLTPVGQPYVPTRRFARRHPTAQAEFHGLRAFRSGDSPRWIHWRTSARCGELMVREFEDVPTDNLILVVDPFLAKGDEREASSSSLEAMVSLAATICWEWCRQKGDHLVLGVAGAVPVVIEGTTSGDHALHLLQCLAGLVGESDPNAAGLVEQLAARPLPAASVLVVSPRDPARLQSAVSLRLHRPVAGLSVTQLHECDFYERPVYVSRNET